MLAPSVVVQDWQRSDTVAIADGDDHSAHAEILCDDVGYRRVTLRPDTTRAHQDRIALGRRCARIRTQRASCARRAAFVRAALARTAAARDRARFAFALPMRTA